jgi:hypothetical protein
MKKYGYLSIALICSLISCINSDLPDVDGMWQLKTIEYADGRIQTVDTIFYSFQKQKLFSFTQLNAGNMQFEPVLIKYGYVEFPAKDRMLIYLDPTHGIDFPLLPPGSESVTYIIRKLTSKEMVLENEEDIYRFIKF